MTTRRLTLAVLALLLAAIGWSSTAGTAYAGGPTSVLLVNPSGGRAAALYHSSPDYQRLVDAINAYGSDLGSTDRPDSVSEDATDAYRLTWLIHDMSIWRIDRIYSTADDGLWLQTLADETGRDPFARPGRWHRVAQPEALTAVLTSTGLTDAAAITVGTLDSCALINDGTVRCWGSNWYGQLGDGTNTDSNTPVTVTVL